MAIESKNLLVWVKAMSRGQALPLDASEVHLSMAEAEAYAASAIAYEGQTVKAKLADGKYHEYILQPSEAGYVLEEVGAVKTTDLVQYVHVVNALPTSGQIEGVLYIHTGEQAGYVWANNAWKKVFWDVSSDIQGLSDELSAAKDELATKAPIANPVFTGTVKVGSDEVALKSYVEGMFANLLSPAPGIVDSVNALPVVDYRAGQHFRVAEAGTYAGFKCEPGDLILVIKDYDAENASNADFMVVQANIDGAVTSSTDVSTDGELIVFDGVTGKVIKRSGVQIASLNDAIAKAHVHENATVLDTYNKTQTELLDAAEETAQGLVDTLSGEMDTALAGKADKATTLAGYNIGDAYNKTEIDAKIGVINDNLNTKESITNVNSKIATAKTETLETVAQNLADRVGDIASDKTVKAYVDEAINATASAATSAIATAKQEAINTANTNTDTKIAEALSIVVF